ncbi:MAG: radical SAM protein [Acidobacteria bacterium]|nr:radical SAM protein [Acidobacteriota bacterium]
MAKVLVLNPPFVDDFVRSARWAARSRGRVQRHPDYLLIATAVLEEAGHTVRFVDGAALNLNQPTVLDMAREFRPDMAVFHTTTPSIYNDVDYARAIREATGARTVLVGNHVSAEPEDTFRIAAGAVDRIVRGEYDLVLRRLAHSFDDTALDGISWLDGGRPVHNPLPPPLDVDELPFPAWHFIDPRWYRDAGKLFPFLTLLSGRGCFAHCTFCQDPQVFSGRRLRMRDPRRVVDEIEYDLRLFPWLREIMFETDTFGASRSHARGVCEEILRRDLDVTWSCNTRVDMDLELLPLMKRAGCRMLMTGFEFGTQAALDAVRKGTTLEQSIAFARRAHELGFIIHGCFMIGAPGETEESARRTIELAKSLPLDTVQFSGICVYPGTELYAWAREHGVLVPGDWREWVSDTCEQVTLLSYPQLPKEKIDELIDRGLREFYLRPRQIVKMTVAVRSWTDIKRKLYGAWSYLRYNVERLFRRERGGGGADRTRGRVGTDDGPTAG